MAQDPNQPPSECEYCGDPSGQCFHCYICGKPIQPYEPLEELAEGYATEHGNAEHLRRKDCLP